MIRRLLQAMFCFVLCPLLVAQQAERAAAPSTPQLPPQPTPAQRYLTLPGDTNLQLLSPGPTTFAKQKTDSVVQFVVDKDVVLSGVPMIHAGVPEAGVVDHVKRGSHFKHRAAEMEIRVTEMISGKPTELHLRCFESGDSSVSAYSQQGPGAGFDPVKWGIITGLVLAGLALWGGDR